nr:SGNH/GDSL hydrolase family protein [Candidatus Dormibacteraeota bacterium]
LNTVNAACPGEATGGFISSTGTDNGCRPFRAAYPLHASYSGTQLAFATAYLAAHPRTRLVTVSLGANDLFLLETACAGNPTCIAAGLPAALGTIAANMNFILHALRSEFHGVLIVVNYYSLDYTDASGTGITKLLNQSETASAHANGAVVANVFRAFQSAAAAAGGKTCNAGLLNASPANQFVCDVHPSQSGQDRIANTVEEVYEAARAA